MTPLTSVSSPKPVQAATRLDFRNVRTYRPVSLDGTELAGKKVGGQPVHGELRVLDNGLFYLALHDGAGNLVYPGSKTCGPLEGNPGGFTIRFSANEPVVTSAKDGLSVVQPGRTSTSVERSYVIGGTSYCLHYSIEPLKPSLHLTFGSTFFKNGRPVVERTLRVDTEELCMRQPPLPDEAGTQFAHATYRIRHFGPDSCVMVESLVVFGKDGAPKRAHFTDRPNIVQQPDDPHQMAERMLDQSLVGLKLDVSETVRRVMEAVEVGGAVVFTKLFSFLADD